MLTVPTKFAFYLLFVCIFSIAAFSQENAGKTNEQKKDKLQATKSKDEFTINKPEGIVRLRVTFLASGEIGEIVVINGLPNGLTEQAVEAARKIKFEPPKKNGVPYSVTKTVEYRFTLFYEEDDAELQKKAEITKMPAPNHPTDENLKSLGGKVNLTIELYPDGDIIIRDVKSDLPQEFQDEARKAASKIKFEPAIHKNGKAVIQIKKIEYEFKSQDE
ncbi:MAG: TonB family protein [Pyrinomonadaceae bacterium]